METQVTLAEMLDARERRYYRQQSLLDEYKNTLLCFTMNIAGPVKNNGLILKGFRTGNIALKERLAAVGIKVLHYEEYTAATGNEAFYVLEGDPLIIKAIAADTEDATQLGRLFDMDVLRPDGSKIDRTELGLSARRCLLCENPSKVCSRSRAHTVSELYSRTMQILAAAAEHGIAEKISALACRALLYEVCTTPKPGLVDRDNTGSHNDMDIFTFIDSTCVLHTYFEKCVYIGIRTAEKPATETFRELRRAGIRAEARMLHATHGVNTHKGAIFSTGIVCGAIGRLSREDRMAPGRILDECAAMTAGLVSHDLAGLADGQAGPGDNAAADPDHTTIRYLPLTTGQRLYLEYGITGIRGQMETGLPAVRNCGLPVLKKGIASGMSINDAGCAALLAIMADTIDTNLIARSDVATQRETAARIKNLLEETPFPDKATLKKLDNNFITRNLSPGGSADLLAISYLLYFLESED